MLLPISGMAILLIIIFEKIPLVDFPTPYFDFNIGSQNNERLHPMALKTTKVLQSLGIV
jgi:hypothetical protein